MAITRAKRVGNVQPFIRSVEKDDNRYTGCQAGVVTYDKDNNYLVSYLEVGMRCDHIVQPILSTIDKARKHSLSDDEKALLPADTLTVTAPLDCDSDLMREPVLHPSETLAPTMTNL